MKIKRLTPADYKTSTWSGGQTTECYIYPEQASYTSRHFDFRISSATIHLPQSTFSPLPNFKRILMMLDGQVRLTHYSPDGKRSVELKPLDKVSCFSGADVTNSYGTGQDFNLIYNAKYHGQMRSLSRETIELAPKTFHFLYAVKNTCLTLETTAERKLSAYPLASGESLLISDLSVPAKLTLTEKRAAVLISIKSRHGMRVRTHTHSTSNR